MPLLINTSAIMGVKILIISYSFALFPLQCNTNATKIQSEWFRKALTLYGHPICIYITPATQSHLYLYGHPITPVSIWAPNHTCIYMGTQSHLYLYGHPITPVSIWTPNHTCIYMDTQSHLYLYGHPITPVSIWAPNRNFADNRKILLSTIKYIKVGVGCTYVIFRITKQWKAYWQGENIIRRPMWSATSSTEPRSRRWVWRGTADATRRTKSTRKRVWGRNGIHQCRCRGCFS